MKYKSDDGREVKLRSIHQMMGNSDYDVVEKEVEDESLNSVVLRDEDGEVTEWIRDG